MYLCEALTLFCGDNTPMKAKNQDLATIGDIGVLVRLDGETLRGEDGEIGSMTRVQTLDPRP
eukprot:1037337-Rhodomonas_salina.1